MILRQLFKYTVRWTLIFTCIFHKVSEAQTTGLTTTSQNTQTAKVSGLTTTSQNTQTAKVSGLTTTSQNTQTAVVTTISSTTILTTTEPNPIRNLTAETLNTTAIKLKWDRPTEYKETYIYQIQTSGCASQNSSTTDEEITITNLTAGTNCLFSVHVQTSDGVKGENRSISKYTKPGTVQPSISNNDTNDTIIVSWNPPDGNVEEYLVVLNGSSSSSSTSSSPLYSNITSHEFHGLVAGKKYTATVISKSGDFSEVSQPVTNATYPNPPGQISIIETTTNSILIKWTPALWMNDSDGFNYAVIIRNSNGTKDYNTTTLSQNLTDLKSGTTHVICVRTTGPLDLQSEPVCSENVTTKPNPIHNLNAETLNTTAIKLKWDRPTEYKETYIYQIQTSGCASQNSSTTDEEITITNLTAGTNCLFSVHVQTSDGVKGENRSISKYTKPGTVQPSISNNGTNDTIIVSWYPPDGNVEEYEVVLNGSSSSSSTSSSPLYSNITSHEFHGLVAGKKYTATVISKSGDFSEVSQPVTNATYPNPPGQISIIETTTNSILIKWTPALWMNDSDGFNYAVIIRNSNGTKDYNTTTLSQNLTDLKSGTTHVICVRTTGPLDLQSEPVCSENVTTKPNPIHNLNAETLNTTAIKLKWDRPTEYKETYIYQIQTSGCASQNSSTTDEEITITNLTAGTNCLFSVHVQTSDGVKGENRSISKYTKPGTVQPSISNNGTNDTIIVSWYPPDGNVEEYLVVLNGSSSSSSTSSSPLYSNITSHEFHGLVAGKKYTATVISKSGDFSEVSQPVTNATYPNPPGQISIKETTTNSILIKWTPALWMNDSDGFNYTVIIRNSNGTKDYNTTTLSQNLTDLKSGTTHVICVRTTGPLDLQSEPVCSENVTTKPNPIHNLNAETLNTTAIKLKWDRPTEYKETYIYQIQTSGCASQNSSTTDEEITITNLTAGTNCLFSVHVQTSDGVKGENRSISKYTKPGTVQPSISNNGTNDTIIVSWNPPDGNVEEYEVVLNGSSSSSSTSSSPLYSNITSHEFHGLVAGKKYTATVISKSGDFSEVSQPVTNATYPNPPGQISIIETTTNSILIKWTPALWMNDSDGFNYAVIIRNSNGTKDYNTTTLSQNLTDLKSGTTHVICVRTTGPLDLQSEPVCSENVTTKPNPIHNLTAETLSTTAIKLKWDKPTEYKDTYIYQIQTSGCASQNSSERDEEIAITKLTPGTNCLFSVHVQTNDGVKGENRSISKYTKPGTVQPSISNNGTNDTIIVSWNHPDGNVEEYVVVLNSSSSSTITPPLYSNITSHEFHGLVAGKKYTATVISKSGDFSEVSQPVTNATYPNPPGEITIKETTTNSILIEWTPALWMNDSDGFNYTVIIRNSIETKGYDTTALFYNLTYLKSGTTHVICVSTTGPLGLQSEPVCENITTKPEKVTSLEADEVSETSIRWKWNKPMEYKDGYRYEVCLSDKDHKVINITNVSVEDHEFTHLTPGVCYHVSVTTFTSDGTKGSPVEHRNCTDTKAAVQLNCVGPNHNPVLNLTWENPEGENNGFYITVWNNSKGIYYKNESHISGTYVHTTSHLAYSTIYNVTIYTLGYGKWGVISTTCTTGITAPPVVSGKDKVEVLVLSHDRIGLSLDPSFLNSINGPIKAYGVLVSQRDDRKFKPEDLQNSYRDWQNKHDLHYLSVLNKTGLKRSVSHTVDPIEIIVGEDDPQVGDYKNGPLAPTKTYRFAIVTFTDLVMTKYSVVDTKQSIFSVSEDLNWSEVLPQNPLVIISSVAATFGVLFLCLCTAIAVLIFLKRRGSGRPSSNIPLSALRAKTSVPVRVEEFDAYYKRQSANSKCGFAEEYEDLKPVGTAQSTTTAGALENKSKNRYSNVLPYEPSRVKLSILSSQFDDYINANYIPGANSRKEFIACQGPLPATVNDFWRMIWEKNIRTIVMLTRCNEQGRVKCEQYWPTENKHYNNIIVMTTSEIALDDWTLRDFDIKNVKTAETRSVRQFHYTAWPDHGVPQTTELLINFRHLVREHMDQYSLHSPTVVHCSAGVGRTGTFIAIDRIIFQIERESNVDVYGIVYEMRMHRPLMVQTEDQYVYLNQCALDIIKSRMGTNVDLIYQNTAAVNIYENIKPNKQ